MAWIYLAESADSQKPWKATSGQSPTVNEIGTPSGFCSLGCTQGTYLPHQSGMTYSLFMEPCSHTLTSFMEGSPAKTLAALDAEKAWAASAADYFSRSSGCAAIYDHDSSSWRTSQQLLFEEQSELLASFAASGMTVAGEFYPLRTWARITDGIGGGCWPTPKAQDAKHATASPSEMNRESPCLSTVVLKTMWPTPKEQDSRAALWDRGKCNLGEVVHGMEVATTGSLNPTWVEWLMGYPSAWTVLEPWATAWFRPKRGKRLSGSSGSSD